MVSRVSQYWSICGPQSAHFVFNFQSLQVVRSECLQIINNDLDHDIVEIMTWSCRLCGDIINTMMIMFNKCLKFHVLMMRWWGCVSHTEQLKYLNWNNKLSFKFSLIVTSSHFWSILMLQAVMGWPGENSGYSDQWPRMKVNHKLTILKMNDSRKKHFPLSWSS